MELRYTKQEYIDLVEYDIGFDNYHVPMNLPLHPFQLLIEVNEINLRWYYGFPPIDANNYEIKYKIEDFLKDIGFEYKEEASTRYEGGLYSLKCSCLEEEEEFFKLFYDRLCKIFKGED